jgi:uncharacterized protein (TIGR03435 family)
MRLHTAAAIVLVAVVWGATTTRAAAQKAARASAAANVLSVVKPSKAGANPGQLQVPIGGRFVASGVTVRELIAASYGGYIPLRPDQIAGGPKWIDSERFDIEAKVDTPDDREPPFSEIDSDADFVAAFAIVRTLLTDRFRLVVHEKTTEGRVYALITSKQNPALGPQLQTSTVDCEAIAARGPFAPPPTARKPGPQGPCGVRVVQGQMIGNGGTMAQLAQRLMMIPSVERDVLDRTGLTGRYDFTLKWTPTVPPRSQDADAAPATDAGPSLFAALQEQLGLKLEPHRGAVRVLVIDRLDRPTAN